MALAVCEEMPDRERVVTVAAWGKNSGCLPAESEDSCSPSGFGVRVPCHAKDSCVRFLLEEMDEPSKFRDEDLLEILAHGKDDRSSRKVAESFKFQNARRRALGLGQYPYSNRR